MRSAQFACVIAALGLMAASVPAVAFTYDNRTNQNSDGSARFVDPQSASDEGGYRSDDGKSSFSMKFSGGPVQPQSGVEQRFLPSSNGAFYSPNDGGTWIDNALGDRHW